MRRVVTIVLLILSHKASAFVSSTYSSTSLKIMVGIKDSRLDPKMSPSSSSSSSSSRSSAPPPFASILSSREWTIPEGVKFGKLSNLRIVNKEYYSLKTTGTGSSDGKTVAKARIATKAVGLNFADVFCVLGLYSAANEIRQTKEGRNSRKNGYKSFVPGLEFAGVVIEDPSGTYNVGDRVLGFTRFGAYADIVDVEVDFLIPLPDSWSYYQGASFIVQALTAWHGLVEIGRMPSLSSSSCYVVIIHSAAGGVGLWASEIAARRGGLVIGVVGNDEKADIFYDRIKEFSPLSRALIRGDEKTFNKRLAHTLCQARREATALNSSNRHEEVYWTTMYDNVESAAKNGFGSDLVMESLGGQYFQDCFNSLNCGGGLVTFGSTTYVSPGLGLNLFRLIWRYIARPMIDPGSLTSRNIRLAGFNLIYLTEQKEELRRQLNDCITCLSGVASSSDQKDYVNIPLDVVTPPVIGEVFSFDTQCVEALEKLKSGLTYGKVVLDNTANRHQI